MELLFGLIGTGAAVGAYILISRFISRRVNEASRSQTEGAGGDLNQQLYAAAVRGDQRRVMALLQLGANIDAPVEYGNRTLAATAGMGDARLEITKLLVSRGADVDIKIGGRSLLTWVLDPAHCDNEATIAFLRASGAKEDSST